MFSDVQVTIPFGTHDDSPVSISFFSSHGSDKFLLDTVLDMYPSLQDVVGTISSSLPLPYINGNMDAAELVKEKVHSLNLLLCLMNSTSNYLLLHIV